MVDGGMIGEHPKLFGEVGLGIEGLRKDVNEAKRMLEELSKEAEKLGKVFDSLGVPNGFKGTSDNLRTSSGNVKKVTAELAKEYEYSAKKIMEGKKKVVEAISHNYSFGHISPEQAHQQLKEYIEEQRRALDKAMRSNASRIGWTKRDGKERELIDTTSFNQEIVKAEAQMKRVWDNWQKTQRANAKSIEAENKRAIEAENKYHSESLSMLKKEEAERNRVNTERRKQVKEAVEEHRNSLKAQIDLDKQRYRQGELDMIQYLNKLKHYERQAQGVFTAKDMNVFAGERMLVGKNYASMLESQSVQERLRFEKEYNLLSKELTDGIINHRKLSYIEDWQEHKKYLELMLADQTKFTKQDYTRLQGELKLVNDKIRKEEVAEWNKYNKVILNNQERAFGNAQQRFRSLMNYTFDATVIYGSIQAVRNMVDAIREIESQSIGIQRVLPSDIDEGIKLDMVEKFRKEAFEVAKLTGQTVNDIQTIQNLWARASDDIAKSSDAMNELTRVTATAMQVGGFQDADEAVRLLNATINQMGLSWQEANEVMNSWVKTADISAVGSAKDLADMISRVGTQAKMMGLTYHDLNGMVAMFANNMSRSGNEIGTAMKTVFSYFEDDRTINTLRQYGVEVMKNAKEFRNFNDIMQDLSDTYQRLELENNTKGIAEMSEALGRIRRRDYVGVLLDHWGETRDIVQASMDALKEGWAETQQELMSDTFEHHMNELKTSFQELAWAVGESGLLEDLKAVVGLIADGATWFANIDPVIKSTILRVLEFSTALFLVSKASQAFTGIGLVSHLANLIAHIGVAKNSQLLLNGAVRAGQTAYIANTSSVIANTQAKVAKNITDAQGNILINTETRSLQANTVVTNQNAQAKLTLANAQKVATRSAGAVAGTVASFINPVTAVISVLGLAVAGFSALSKSQEEATRRTKQLETAQKSLRNILSQKVVDEHQIPEIDNISKEIEEQYNRYVEANEKIEEAREIMQSRIDLYGKHNYLRYSRDLVYQEASFSIIDWGKVVKDAESRIKELGSSVEEAEKQISGLNKIVEDSSDSITRDAYSAIESIEANHARNDSVRQLISSYEELIGIENRSHEQTLELKDVIDRLATQFPNEKFLGNYDPSTGLYEVHIDAIREEIGELGNLTEEQKRAIETSIHLDDIRLQRAIDIKKAEIEALKASKKFSEERIKIIKDEKKAIQGIFLVDSVLNSTIEPHGKTLFSSIVDQQIRNNESKIVDEQQAKIDEYERQLSLAEGTLEALMGIDPYSPDKWESDGGKDRSLSDSIGDLMDFQSDKIDEINSLLSIMQSELELIDETEENRAKRMEKINKIRDLEAKKLEVIRGHNNTLAIQLEEVNRQLESYVSGWSKMDGDQKFSAINSMTVEQRESIDELLSSYNELTSSIRSNKEEIASTQVVIKEYLDTIREMEIEGIGNRLSRIFNADNAISEYGISKIKDEIDTLKRYLDALGDDERSRQMEYNISLIEKEVQLHSAIQEQNKMHTGTLRELNRQIDSYVSGWGKMSADDQVKALNSLTDDQREKLSPILDLWEEITEQIKDSKKAMADSGEAISDYENALVDIVEHQYRQGLELEKQIANRRLLAKQEQEQLALQREIFGMTLESFEISNQAKIDEKQRELDLLEEEIRLRERNNQLQEIEAEMAKVLADTRFAYIDEATGREVYTYDRARYKELQKQKDDLLQQSNDDDRRKQLQDEIDNLTEVADRLREVYDKRLDDLQKYQDYEKESFEKHWEDRMRDEVVRQTVLEAIRTQGYNNALQNATNFMEANKNIIEGYNRPMYELGKTLNESLMTGLSSEMDSYIQQKSDEMFKLGQAIRSSFNAGLGGSTGYSSPFSGGVSQSIESVKAQMASNSAKWHTSSPEVRKQLEEANQQLGRSVGGTFDPRTGKWTFPNYHVGGFVGGMAYNPVHEEIAKLLKGEFVMTPPMLDNLAMALRLPDFKMSVPDVSAGVKIGDGRSTIIHINKVEANNFEEFMRSIDPYITSQG